MNNKLVFNFHVKNSAGEIISVQMTNGGLPQVGLPNQSFDVEISAHTEEEMVEQALTNFMATLYVAMYGRLDTDGNFDSFNRFMKYYSQINKETYKNVQKKTEEVK